MEERECVWRRGSANEQSERECKGKLRLLVKRMRGSAKVSYKVTKNI
jgi:hypothetical protein